MSKSKKISLQKLSYIKLHILILYSGFILLLIVSVGEGKSFIFNQKDAKAEEILELARQATGRKATTDGIKFLSAVFTGDYQPTKAESLKQRVSYSFESKWQFEITGKLNVQDSINYASNRELKEVTVNNEAVASFNKIILNGQTVQTSVSPENQQKIAAEDKLKYKTKSFVNFFPLLLRWSANTEFRFIGTTETKDGQAAVLETIMPDKSRWQLFFDQKSHLLMLMIQTSFDEEAKEKRESRYFLSDYKEDTGLFIPHKITSQQDGEVVQEQLLKTIKINPILKPDTFEIEKR